MGSPNTAMLGNAGAGGALAGQCGPHNNDPILRQELGCPPLAAAPQEALPQQAVREDLPTAPDYAGVAEALQRSPELAGSGALQPSAEAGGLAYQGLSPAVDAEQARLAPNPLQQLLLSIFGRGGA